MLVNRQCIYIIHIPQLPSLILLHNSQTSMNEKQQQQTMSSANSPTNTPASHQLTRSKIKDWRYVFNLHPIPFQPNHH